jgi:tetratricopeptide (TPR) repeat protein
VRLRVLLLLLAVAVALPVFADWTAGVNAYRNKDYARAIKEFEKVTRTNPDYAGAYYMLGLAQNGAGKISSALKEHARANEWFAKAKQKKPRNSLVCFYRGQCYASLNQLDNALNELQEALAIGASGSLRTKIYTQMGLVYMEQKELQKARTAYEEAGNAEKVREMDIEPGNVSLPECPGFRETKWGASRAEVAAVEGEPVDSEEDRLVYAGSLAGKDVLIAFRFVDDQLTTGNYLLTEKYTFDNQYIDDFKMFKELLAEKYGIPAEDRVEWENDLYRNDPGNWGQAVSIGHVTYLARWVTDKTDIVIVLSGKNFDCSLGISYFSREHRDLTEEASKKKALEARPETPFVARLERWCHMCGMTRSRKPQT